MIQKIDAIFVNGVFRPEQPVNIGEGQHVVLNVEAKSRLAEDLSEIDDLLDHEFMESCRREAGPTASLEEVQRILSAVPGSLADHISAERDER